MLTWDELDGSIHSPLAHYQTIRRDGAFIPFEPSRTSAALVVQALGWMLCAKRKLVGAGLGVLPNQRSLSIRAQKPKRQCGFYSANKADLRHAP